MAFNTAIGRAEYTASAAQTIFTFTFKIYNTSDVKVYLTPVGQTADDTTDILIETTDYTITINGDNGGDVTLTSGAALNDAITLVRDLPVDRDTEYQQNGDLTAEALNEDQDYQTYLILDGSLKTNERALIVPDSAQDFDTSLPAPGADKMFIYASDGKSIKLIDPSNTDFFKEAFIVNSMQALLGVDENTYGSVNVRGYYTISDGGGDLFNWDSTIDKSTANAGTIIDPDETLANQGNGTGNGCWVRQYSKAVTPEYFGAKGDGSTDDTASLILMFKVGTLFELNRNYKITTVALNIINENHSIYGNGILSVYDNGEGLKITVPGLFTSKLSILGLDFEALDTTCISALTLKIDTPTFQQESQVFIDMCRFGDQENTDYTFDYNITIDNIQQSNMSNISIAGDPLNSTLGIGVRLLNQCTDINIDNLKTYHLNKVISSTSESEGIKVTNSTFVKPYYGIYLVATAANPYFSMINTHINSLYRSIHLDGYSQNFIANNLMYLRGDAELDANDIYIAGCNNTIIENNIFTSGHGGSSVIAIDVNTSSYCRIENNTFTSRPTEVKLDALSIQNIINNMSVDNTTQNIVGNNATNNAIGFGGREYIALILGGVSISDSAETKLINTLISSDNPSYYVTALAGGGATVPGNITNTYATIMASGEWVSNNTGGRKIILKINDVEVRRYSYNSSDESGYSFNFGKFLLTEGDDIDVHVYQDSGAPLSCSDCTVKIVPVK